MFIEINDRERELRFDLNFIRHLNETFKADAYGLKMPMGVTIAMMQLQQGDASALSDVVRCALNKSLSAETVDAVITKYAEEDKLDGLLDEVIDEMGKSLFVKNQLKKAEQQSK